MDKDVIKRKKKQKSGIISGLIFILIATLLLFYNERRAVDAEKVISIAKKRINRSIFVHN